MFILFVDMTCPSEALIATFQYDTSMFFRLSKCVVADGIFLSDFTQLQNDKKGILFQTNSQQTIVRGGGASCFWLTAWANKWETRMFVWSFVGLALYLHAITCFCQPTKCSFILSLLQCIWVKNTHMHINTHASLACRLEPKHTFKRINNHSPWSVST